MAQEALTGLQLQQIRFIPAGQPPHRAPPHVSATARLEMVRLACAGNPGFVVDAREVERDAPSYTLHTLTELRTDFGPDQAFFLLLGADAFLGLSTWHHWQELFSLAHLVIVYRPGFPQSAWAESMPPDLRQEYAARRTSDLSALNHTVSGQIYALPSTALDITASRIRAAIQCGVSPRYLLPDTVLNYISTHKLYKE